LNERHLACLDSTVLLLFLVKTSIPMEMFRFNELRGIESKKSPFVMCSLLCVSIFGEIFIIQHHLKTLMSFYSHAPISLALPMLHALQLKMGKVQVLSRQEYTARP